MKLIPTKTVFLGFIIGTLACCKPENATPTASATTSGFDMTKASLIKKGDFVEVSHGPTTGTAHVYDQAGTKYVVLDPFVSPSGPDLKVYFSKDKNASDYIRLGKLLSTRGKQEYIVPGSPIVGDYHYVHIWCEAFSVEFSHAEIK